MNIIERVRGWLDANSRNTDIRVLWPVCCAMAENENGARRAFYTHALTDRAWLRLGTVEMRRTIEALRYSGFDNPVDK